MVYLFLIWKNLVIFPLKALKLQLKISTLSLFFSLHDFFELLSFNVSRTAPSHHQLSPTHPPTHSTCLSALPDLIGWMIDKSSHVLVFTLVQISGGIWDLGLLLNVSSSPHSTNLSLLSSDFRADMGNTQSDQSILFGLCNVFFSNKEKRLPSDAEGKTHSLFVSLWHVWIICVGTTGLTDYKTPQLPDRTAKALFIKWKFPLQILK